MKTLLVCCLPALAVTLTRAQWVDTTLTVAAGPFPLTVLG